MVNKNWTKLDDKLLNKTRIFDLRAQRMRSPDGSYEDDFYYTIPRLGKHNPHHKKQRSCHGQTISPWNQPNEPRNSGRPSRFGGGP